MLKDGHCTGMHGWVPTCSQEQWVVVMVVLQVDVHVWSGKKVDSSFWRD